MVIGLLWAAEDGAGVRDRFVASGGAPRRTWRFRAHADGAVAQLPSGTRRVAVEVLDCAGAVNRSAIDACGCLTRRAGGVLGVEHAPHNR